MLVVYKPPLRHNLKFRGVEMLIYYRIRIKFCDILGLDFLKPKNGEFDFFSQIIQNFARESIYNF